MLLHRAAIILHLEITAYFSMLHQMAHSDLPNVCAFCDFKSIFVNVCIK